MKTILIVEDELSIRSFIRLNLRKKGYELFEASSGEEALVLFKSNKIDILLLDLMLPGMDGYQVCDKIRSTSQSVGIIILTARTQDEDKVKGLIQGADDYLTKPFSMAELEARIISLLRRLDYKENPMKEEYITSGPFLLDTANRKLSREGKEIKVTPTEFSLLYFLVSHKNKVFDRDEILNEIWGIDYIGDGKVVDVNVRRLRRKIEKDPSNPGYLCTECGLCYLWREQGNEA